MCDAVLGLNRPRLGLAERTPTRSGGCLESLPTPRRNLILENLRLQQIYDMVYAVALDSALATTPIGRVRRWFPRKVLGETDMIESGTGPDALPRSCSSSSARPT